ncbi:hypothetical protein B296_00003092 [Ensete ventricosum]|uniref:Uncharacterized protein n=1 Tax=Ensete ventricosum TaxID=4639 RepID=A0A426YDX6_ENSVE|nr:hypothetical protein B296_00003092 [Ensete ventricosum]
MFERLSRPGWRAGWPVAFALPCRQSPAVRGAVGWLARRIHSAMRPTAHCQGRCMLVSSSRPMCHATSRPLSGMLLASRPIAFALPCGQLCYRAVGRPWSSVLRVGWGFRSSSYLC